jgi:hypothetical protein
MRYLFLITIISFFSCTGAPGNSRWAVHAELPKPLKEVSGITAVGNTIYAISDKPKPVIYQLDERGKLISTININGFKPNDVEAITSDADNLYIGDVGDNDGVRNDRTILKISKGSLQSTTTQGEAIVFTFPGEGEAQGKRDNNYDCEAIISFAGSLYVFTKDREDKETRMYQLPNQPGRYEAKFINKFDVNGLVTDAAVNASGTELALIGYHKGHVKPFVLLFNNFKGNDFFSGKSQRIQLGDKNDEWQIEGITYANDNRLYLTAEGGKKSNAEFYAVDRDQLIKMDNKN